MSTIRIGTRGSALALAQSRGIAADLARLTGETPEIVVVRTTGDADQTTRLAAFGGAGAFTTEIDGAQREGRFDVSVHSLKDLPTQGREGLTLVAVPPRAPVEDCLVARDGATLATLPRGAVVGTGSERRRAALRRLRPDLELVAIRGNVDTRLRRVREGDVDATLLAHAGLSRLALLDAVTEVIAPDVLVPAAGQGALAIVVREDAAASVHDAVRRLDDAATRAEIVAERAVLARLGGGCHLPLGALARCSGGRLRLHARVIAPDGSAAIDECAEGASADAAEIGDRLGTRLVEAGAHALLGT